MIKQREASKPKLKRFAFILLGIFLGGLGLRIALFFFGVPIHPPYSHMVNYPIITSILIYSALQVYYYTKKHKLL